MMRRSRVALFSAGVLAAGGLVVASAPNGYADVTALVKVSGLRAPASVVRDDDGVAHIRAQNPHDLFFLQGWVHADDRLFQMDYRRRQGSGTLAELLGSSALPSDVQLRTFGLRRTTERSLSLLSSETRTDLGAYADGVNAWIARNPLGNVGRLQGGVQILAEARPDDGVLDVAVVMPPTRRSWFPLAWALLRRRPKAPTMETFRGRHIEITSDREQPRELDGDLTEASDRLTVEVRPAALWLCAPTSR